MTRKTTCELPKHVPIELTKKCRERIEGELKKGEVFIVGVVAINASMPVRKRRRNKVKGK